MEVPGTIVLRKSIWWTFLPRVGALAERAQAHSFFLIATPAHHLLLSAFAKCQCFLTDKTPWCRCQEPATRCTLPEPRASESRLPQLWGQCSLSLASPSWRPPGLPFEPAKWLCPWFKSCHFTTLL